MAVSDAVSTDLDPALARDTIALPKAITGPSMSTYKELLAQREALEQKIRDLRH
jgi:hypothetical protein